MIIRTKPGAESKKGSAAEGLQELKSAFLKSREQTERLERVIRLCETARAASDRRALGYTALNDTLAAIDYRQAALWWRAADDAGAGRIEGLSGVADPVRNAAFPAWLVKRLGGFADAHPAGASSLSGSALADELVQPFNVLEHPPAADHDRMMAKEFLPAQALWAELPLKAPQAGGTGISNVGKLTMDGGIYAGVTGKAASGDVGVSTGTARKEIINITATDAASSITGDLEATNRSETNITFVNGGTFTGDIVAKNITNEDGKIPEDSKDITTVSKISLNGQMTYKGDATLVGASELKLSGDIDGSESTVNSSEDSAVSVEGAISLGTVTSTSSKGVTITDGSLLTLSNGESSISELNSDGDLYLSETATAKLNTVTGKATITVDSAANTAAITKVASGSAVTARATAHFNDASASASDALTSLLETVTVGDGSSLSEAVVEEGDVNNKVTATIEDGKVVSQTETKNSKLDAFNSIATLSAFQWRHEMNDLTKRMGELRDSEGTIGAWARVYGSELQYGDQNVKQKSNSIQVGSDIEVAPGFKVGAAFNYTNGSAEYNNGDADNNAYGLGIYGTWMAENGMFLDVIAKYVRLDTDFSLNGFDGSFDNNAYSLSAEFGWRFDLNDLAFVEPQVELSYGRVAGDTFTAANGVTVKQDDFDTLIGRAGVRAGFKFPENKGNIYAKFSVAHDFQGEMDAVATNGTALNTMHSDIGGTWVEYGVGGNFRLCKNAYGYVDLERTSGAEVNANYRWNIGLRTFF
ncbi:autotransporter outer membrane beta-barrel domain-containing protein [Sutterella wadsworthensis]|uniref:autotransporter outer membrane beta-barrel domain-containing protein n=1 Tax=Sutterella wadsworthensis TaxID=40545 RepID=UPI00402AF8C2